MRGSIWRCRGSLWRSLATLSTAFPGVWPIETASALCLSTKPLPVCLCAGRHKGWRTGRQVGKDASPEAGRRADRFACKGKGLSQRLYPFAVAWQHLALLWQLVAFFTRPYRHSSCVWLVAVIWHFHHSNACMPACRQAQGQADWQAGELAGGQECLPVRKSENGQAGNYVFFTCVAAFGAVVAACGVFEPYFRHGKHPTFAPKRQGKAESAYRRPRPVLLLGSKKVSGDRCLING